MTHTRHLTDDERNLLASLAHEADEPCAACGAGVTPNTYPNPRTWDYTTSDGRPLCEECDDPGPTYDQRMLAGEHIPLDVLLASCEGCGNYPAVTVTGMCRSCGDDT